MNNNTISHLYCKNVQEIYIELQNIQKKLHCSRTIKLATVLVPYPIVNKYSHVSLIKWVLIWFDIYIHRESHLSGK